MAFKILVLRSIGFMSQLFVLVTICVLGINSSSVDEEPIVSLDSGFVRGFVQKSPKGRSFYSFRGIPYGISERFEAPVLPPKWTEVLDGTQLGPICPQFNFISRGVEGIEDCLVANVYTTQKNNSKGSGVPVLVFIHGGAFYMGTGSGELFGPGKFMDHGDVVLITFNYRLGILGFLNTHDDASCGNYGLLDQVLLLRWVQNNVAKFGGDPDRVTLFGQSAGAASVIYHMISPLSSGLFSRAIAQSGSAFCPWAYQVDPLDWAKQLGARLDCNTKDTFQLVQCFREKSTYEIIRAGESMKHTQFTPHLTAPSSEKCSNPKFISEDPIETLIKGKVANKVPLVIGVTKDESYVFYKDWQKVMRYRGQKFLDHELELGIGELLPVDKQYLKEYTDIVRKYFDGTDVENPSSFDETAMKFMDDALYNLCTMKTAEWLANSRVGIPIKTYIYTHIGQHSFAETFGSDPGTFASHADELYIQFAFFYAQIEEPTAKDKRMSDIINTLWIQYASGRNTSFQLSDNTILEWPMFDYRSPNFLNLGLQPRIENGTFWERKDLWLDHLTFLEQSLV